MKTFIILFVLFFSSSVFAEDISDFQIEGMSIGDSLLDYYSLEEIENVHHEKYKNDEYRYYIFNLIDSNYDYLQITIKTETIKNESINKKSSNQFIIHSIAGMINFVNNIDECYLKQGEIKEELDKYFGINGKKGNFNHPMDETGNSTVVSVDYYFDNSLYNDATIDCYDISKKLEDQGYKDSMKIAIYTQEYQKFINEVNWQ